MEKCNQKINVSRETFIENIKSTLYLKHLLDKWKEKCYTNFNEKER